MPFVLCPQSGRAVAREVTRAFWMRATMLCLLLSLLCACGGPSHTRLPRVPEAIAHEFESMQDTVVVFVDFACPYSRMQSEQLEDLLRIDRNVVLRFHFVPSTEASLSLSEVAACAEGQALGTPVTLALFRESSASQHRAIEIAASLGVDAADLTRCVAEPSTVNGLLRHVALSQQLGVTGLPTAFIRENRFDGVAPAEVLSQSVISHR